MRLAAGLPGQSRPSGLALCLQLRPSPVPVALMWLPQPRLQPRVCVVLSILSSRLRGVIPWPRV